MASAVGRAEAVGASPEQANAALEGALDEVGDDAIEAAAEGGLSSAGGAHEDEEIAGHEIEGDAVERGTVRVAVREPQLANREDGLGRGRVWLHRAQAL